MSDTRDQDRLDDNVQKREKTEAETPSDEQSTPRHAEGSLDVINEPERAALPDDRPWLAPDGPTGGPRETVDPRANTPEGHAVERNLTDLNDGFGRDITTGPNHHGVGTTYDQDKKVGGENDIEGMLHPSGPAKAPPPPPEGGRDEKGTGGNVVTTGGSEKGGGSTAGGGHGSPPPGVELGFRAPKWDQVGADGEGRVNTTAAQLEGLVGGGGAEPKGPTAKEQIAERRALVEKAGGKPDPPPVLKPYDPKKMTDGESGPVPVWVPGADGPPVNKGDWVAQPVNPDLGGGDNDDPTIDPSVPRAGVDPGVIDKDPDYQEASVPSAPPAVTPGDEISKTMNPDHLPPTIPPGSGGGGQGGGGQPDGRAAVPDVVAAAPAEAAPPAAAEPAPAPTVDQQLAPPDFEGPPDAAGAGGGAPADVDPDGDGLPG